MILDLPPANGRDTVRNDRRLPATANDMRRRPVSLAPPNGAGYGEIMNRVEVEKAVKPTVDAAPVKSTWVGLWQNEEFGFGDFLDVVNPLHHIPIVATVYRNLTADKIGFVPRVIGGALWGRVGGFVAGLVNAAVEWFTGKDVGDHIFAAIWGEKAPDDNPVIAQTAVDKTGDCNELVQVSPEDAPVWGGLSRAPQEVSVIEPDGPIENLTPDSGLIPPLPTSLVPDAALLKRFYDFPEPSESTQVASAGARGMIRLLA